MNSKLFYTGIACIVAAIVGGGLEAAGFKFPVLGSLKRQSLLALFGFALLISSFVGPAITGSGSGNAVKWADLVSGGNLPYGRNVTLKGHLSDLRCGSTSISDVLDVTAISVSFLGQISQPTASAVAGNDWTASLGPLPADTAINLQLKITGKISDAKKKEIVDYLLADDPAIPDSIREFADRSKDQDATVSNALARQLLTNISGKTATILEEQLPSCTVVTAVTAAAVAGLGNVAQLGVTALIRLQQESTRLKDLTTLSEVVKLDGFDPKMPPRDIAKFLRGLASSGRYTKDGGKPLTTNESVAVDMVVKLFLDSYEPLVYAIAGDVIAKLRQTVQLGQSSATTRESKIF